MKKFISVIILASILFSAFSFNSFAASDDYKATWNLKASVLDAGADEKTDKANYLKGGSTVYDSKSAKDINVCPGQVVWVTIHVKAGSLYYASNLQDYLYYSKSVFCSAKSDNFIWNTKGKFTASCGDYLYGTVYNNPKNPKGFPSSWSDSKKNSYEYYNLIMLRDDLNVTAKISNIDEDLVTFPIYVKKDAKPGTKGEILIDDMCSDKNPNGKSYLAYYKNGNMKEEKKCEGTTQDISKAKLTFTVVNNGEQPSQETSIFKLILDFIVKYILFGWIWNK